LPEAEGDTGRLSREHVVDVGPGGMISVAGGKLTTHRLIAVDVLRRLPPELRPAGLRPSDAPLPGAERAPSSALLAGLDRHVAEHLLHLYGGEAERLLRDAARFPDALERVDPAGPDVWAQVHHAVEREWALTVEDVVQRRTTLAVRGLAGEAVRGRIAQLVPAEFRAIAAG
jgi:glycerol-3-phosphate dehydrogenase